MNEEEAMYMLEKTQVILSHQAIQESEIVGIENSESFKYHQAIQFLLEKCINQQKETEKWKNKAIYSNENILNKIRRIEELEE